MEAASLGELCVRGRGSVCVGGGGCEAGRHDLPALRSPDCIKWRQWRILSSVSNVSSHPCLAHVVRICAKGYDKTGDTFKLASLSLGAQKPISKLRHQIVPHAKPISLFCGPDGWRAFASATSLRTMECGLHNRIMAKSS